MQVQIKTKNENLKEVCQLVEKIEKENPKESDIKALRKLAKSDDLLFQSIGNYGQSVYQEILETSIDNKILIEGVDLYISQMKTELGYENSTFVEKMLIDEIAVRWLSLQHISRLHHLKLIGSHSSSDGNYWDKRLNASQHRYLKAISSLTKVRKMIATAQAKSAKMFKDLMSDN